MSKCLNCNCVCHCSLKEHSDMNGVCSCTACACNSETEHLSGEVIVDDTNDCEGCG